MKNSDFTREELNNYMNAVVARYLALSKIKTCLNKNSNGNVAKEIAHAISFLEKYDMEQAKVLSNIFTEERIKGFSNHKTKASSHGKNFPRNYLIIELDALLDKLKIISEKDEEYFDECLNNLSYELSRAECEQELI